MHAQQATAETLSVPATYLVPPSELSFICTGGEACQTKTRFPKMSLQKQKWMDLAIKTAAQNCPKFHEIAKRQTPQKNLQIFLGFFFLLIRFRSLGNTNNHRKRGHSSHLDNKSGMDTVSGYLSSQHPLSDYLLCIMMADSAAANVSSDSKIR